MQLTTRYKHTLNNDHSKTLFGEKIIVEVLLGEKKIIVAVLFHSRLQEENADGLFIELMISDLFAFCIINDHNLNHQSL